MATMKVLDAKMVVLGVQGVGKTSLIIRHTSNIYNKCVSPTIGASFFSCILTDGDYKIRLQIWDTAGQERFRAMAPMYYRNANSSFLVFDITSYESYMGMKTWVEALKQNIDGFVHICIVGNKSDLESKREVKTEEAREYADMMGADYVETSALENDGVETAFSFVAKGLIRQYENGNSIIKVVTYSSNGSGQYDTTLPASSNSSITLTSTSLPERDDIQGICC